MMRGLRNSVLALACALSCSDAWAYAAMDIDGNAFEFEKPPRIVSITPSVSETVCELGMSGSLLGVSRYCDRPEQLKDKPKLGGFVDPDYEKIFTLRPDLAILPKTSDSTVRDRLKRLGIPCFLIHPDGIENISKNVLLIGEVLDKKAEAKKISDGIEAEIAPAKNARRPKAILLFGKMAAGKGSFAGGLLERAGFENIAAKAKTPWPVLSREFILLNPPEVIILEVKEDESFEKLSAALKKDPPWARTPAAKNGKIYPLDSSIIIVPGPRIVEASKRLKEIAAEQN